MASNIQIANQMNANITSEQQSIKTTKAKTSKTKVSKKVICSNSLSVAATATAKIENLTTTIMENVSSSNTVTEVFENTTTSTTNHSLESKNIENRSNIVLDSTPKQNGGGELLPSENGVVKAKTVKMKTSTSSSSLANGKKQSKKVKKSNQLEKENISVYTKLQYGEQKNILRSNTALVRDTQETSLESFSDSSTDSNKLRILSKNNIENENNINNTLFTSIKDNPFILNAVSCCGVIGGAKSVICGYKKPDVNKIISNSHQNHHATLILGSDSIKSSNSRDLGSIDFSSAAASKNQTMMLTEFSMTNNKKHLKTDDGLGNIDVKQLKAVYLAADAASSCSCKTQKRSINKASKQDQSLTIRNLCRSFGDLSFIRNNDTGTYRHHLKRTKSVGDLGKFKSLLKYFEWYGVSVKALRDSYCNLIGLNASTNVVFNGVTTTNNQKSSFSKFDALQKRNLIHVRSSDAGKAQEKFTDINAEKKQDCHVCQKEVYKMEEIKAEKNIYHKNCFRCNECEKQLKVDNYQSHEGVLYCKAHFKSLFMPKVVEETAQDKPRKPELIIRENQPLELPPDVIRASDKPDLGLEELQQINIRSKFEAFEKPQVENDDNRTLEHNQSTVGVKRSASILSKLAKFQAKGSVNNGTDDQDIIPYEEESDSDGESSVADDVESDPDLVRAKGSQRERPVGLGNMNDIKSKFETGHIMSKEERREERKQEIQNIRSRLFMGKQARIKEMYQQAVAESEHGITSVGKKSEIEIGDKARCLKEKFEKGEIFKEYDETARVPEDELEVFESAISKRSRSLFQELDASAVKNQPTPRKRLSSSNDQRNRSFDCQNLVNSSSTDIIVKHDEKIDDVQIETSDISSKFKFFETYKPVENEKKTFRITPPREGVVKLPTPESDDELADKRVTVVDTEPAEKTHTATIMLSKFRELEQTKNNNSAYLGPRSLKCFTPPPDDNRRVYNESESDMDNMSEEEEEEDYDEEGGEEEDSDYNEVHVDARSRDHLEDEALIQAQSAARAKQLRAKFEKWEASEIQREIQDGTINLYEDNSEENQIESAKAIRAKFENMKETQSKQPTRPRYKVNRFV